MILNTRVLAAFTSPTLRLQKQDEQLLEISLPAEIDISPFEIFAPGARWREWSVPANIINQYGKTRLLPDDERDQALLDRIIEMRKELVAEGLLEQAKDSQGQVIYRNGKPVWRITEKGRISGAVRDAGLMLGVTCGNQSNQTIKRPTERWFAKTTSGRHALKDKSPV